MREGGRTHTYRLTVAAQDAGSEEAAMLVKDRRGLKVEAQEGWCRKKTSEWEDGGIRNIREERTLSAHSETMPLRAHSKAMPSSTYYYQLRSLNNKLFFVKDNIS